MAGISAERTVIERLIRKPAAPLSTAQLAINLSNIGSMADSFSRSKLFLVANHPFGGPSGIAGTRESIAALATSPDLPATLRNKLAGDDPQLLPELIFNAILSGTGVSAVIPAMIKPEHIAANIRAIEDCRFTAAELAQVRTALAAGTLAPELVPA